MNGIKKNSSFALSSAITGKFFVMRAEIIVSTFFRFTLHLQCIRPVLQIFCTFVLYVYMLLLSRKNKECSFK